MIVRSAPTHKRHNLNLIPIFKRLIVLVRTRQSFVQLDRYFFRNEIKLREKMTDGRAIRDLFGLAIHN